MGRTASFEIQSECALLEALFRHKSGVFRAFMHVFVVLERGVFVYFQQVRRAFAGKPKFVCFGEVLPREILAY
jgi:hypothetical protein